MPQPLSPAAAWLHRNWDELRRFNFQGVAATAEQLIDGNEDLGILMAQIRGLGLADEVAYAFVDFDEEIGAGGVSEEAS